MGLGTINGHIVMADTTVDDDGGNLVRFTVVLAELRGVMRTITLVSSSAVLGYWSHIRSDGTESGVYFDRCDALQAALFDLQQEEDARQAQVQVRATLRAERDEAVQAVERWREVYWDVFGDYRNATAALERARRALDN